MAQVSDCLAACKDILSRMPREAAEGGWRQSSSRWTARLFEQLQACGTRDGFDVRPCSGELRTSGWLYDLVWLRRAADTSLQHVFLVAESEWEPSHPKIIDDFEKLLLARADLRLMIFNRRKHSQVLETMGDMEHRIRSFEQSKPGDKYFLAGLAWDTDAFEYREVHL